MKTFVTTIIALGVMITLEASHPASADSAATYTSEKSNFEAARWYRTWRTGPGWDRGPGWGWRRGPGWGWRRGW